MDDQNYQGDQSNQNNQQGMPAEIPPAYVPPETPPEAQPQPLTAPIDMPPHSAKKKSPIVLAITTLVAALLGIGLGSFYILYGQVSPKKSEPNTSQQQPEATTFTQPDQLIYYRGMGTTSPQMLFARSLTSNEENKALTLPLKNYIGYVAIYGNRVAFTTSPGGDVDGTSAIYYSVDSGKSYKKIYSAPETASKFLRTQITSLVFSSDGKTLLAGILLAEEVKAGNQGTGIAHKNQVTELSLEQDNSTKVLFTSDAPGVALKGYDSGKRKIIYLASGCYNCEPTYSDIYSYDLKTKAQDTLYHSDYLSENITVNKDFTEVLALEAKPGDGHSTTTPHTLFTINTATKTQEIIKTFDSNEPLREAGYTPEGIPYIASNTSVQELDNGTPKTLFQLSGGNDAFSVPWVLFASANGVVGNVTASTQNDNRATAIFSIMYSKPGDTTPTKVMEIGTLNGDTTPMGVTRK